MNFSTEKIWSRRSSHRWKLSFFRIWILNQISMMKTLLQRTENCSRHTEKWKTLSLGCHSHACKLVLVEIFIEFNTIVSHSWVFVQLRLRRMQRISGGSVSIFSMMLFTIVKCVGCWITRIVEISMQNKFQKFKVE